MDSEPPVHLGGNPERDIEGEWKVRIWPSIALGLSAQNLGKLPQGVEYFTVCRKVLQVLHVLFAERCSLE